MPSTNLRRQKNSFRSSSMDFPGLWPGLRGLRDGRTTGGFFASEITSTVAQGIRWLCSTQPTSRKCRAKWSGLAAKKSGRFLNFQAAAVFISRRPAWRIRDLVRKSTGRSFRCSRAFRVAERICPRRHSRAVLYENIGRGRARGMKLRERIDQLAARGTSCCGFSGFPFRFILFFLLRVAHRGLGRG